MRTTRTAIAFAFAIAIAGCGGGGERTVPATSRLPGSAQTARVTFTMHWSSVSASAGHRNPKYVPVTAQSVSVAVNGGLLQYLNAPATTLSIDAPVGTDQFVFATYDDAAGQGNVLSRAAVTKTIVDGAANVVSAILEGIPASVAIALGNLAPNAGTAATIPITVSAKDADGNTIIGSSDYTVPIALTINDPSASGTLSLSKSVVSSPAGTANLIYSGGTLVSASVTASAAGLSAVSAALKPTPTFYPYQVPGASGLFGVAAGPDGNMWFTDSGRDTIGRITPAGVVTEFPVPTAGAEPEAITAGPDGRLWFTEPTTAKIGAITIAGQVTEYAAPSGCVSEAIGSRAADQTIWYGCDSGTVNVVNGGSATVGGEPFGIVAGPDNKMYVGGYATGTVRQITNTGNSVNAISTGSGSAPSGLAVGSDGAIWYTDRALSVIGRISTASSSVTATFPTLTASAQPNGITAGTDGALWFTEFQSGKIGRITTAGVMTEYTSPITNDFAFTIATAKDGSLWIPYFGSATIEKLVY